MSDLTDAPKFVPIVLTDTEAIAAAAGCMAVALSAPVGAGPGHPLFEAALKIEAARKAVSDA